MSIIYPNFTFLLMAGPIYTDKVLMRFVSDLIKLCDLLEGDNSISEQDKDRIKAIIMRVILLITDFKSPNSLPGRIWTQSSLSGGFSVSNSDIVIYGKIIGATVPKRTDVLAAQNKLGEGPFCDSWLLAWGVLASELIRNVALIIPLLQPFRILSSFYKTVDTINRNLIQHKVEECILDARGWERPIDGKKVIFLAKSFAWLSASFPGSKIQGVLDRCSTHTPTYNPDGSSQPGTATPEFSANANISELEFSDHRMGLPRDICILLTRKALYVFVGLKLKEDLKNMLENPNELVSSLVRFYKSLSDKSKHNLINSVQETGSNPLNKSNDISEKKKYWNSVIVELIYFAKSRANEVHIIKIFNEYASRRLGEQENQTELQSLSPEQCQDIMSRNPETCETIGNILIDMFVWQTPKRELLERTTEMLLQSFLLFVRTLTLMTLKNLSRKCPLNGSGDTLSAYHCVVYKIAQGISGESLQGRLPDVLKNRRDNPSSVSKQLRKRKTQNKLPEDTN